MLKKILRAALLCLLLPAASAPAENLVQAGRYTEFWIWGGVDASRVSAFAKRWYVLQGHIGGAVDKPVFTLQGIPALNQAGEVVLVYRLNVLAWNETIRATLLNHIVAWEYRGNKVLGIQLDFDARTHNLAQYADYLRQLRQNLPAAYSLSVTGLMDCAGQGDPASLQNLRGIVDEIIFQTYQGKQTVRNYPAYLQAVARLPLPFKIGLVEGGVWDRQYESALRNSGYFRGCVVFLLPKQKSYR